MKRYLSAIIILVCFSTFVSASFSFDTYSIGTKYPEKSYLSGWIKLNFTNESFGSLFTDNLGNSVSLESVLNNSDYNYTCLPSDCKTYYAASNSAEEKSFQVKKGESKVLGFKFVGNLEQINSMTFSFSSTASESQTNQLKVDIFNDGVIDTGNTNEGLTNSGVQNVGCFDSSMDYEEATIGTLPYCQKMNLSEAPAFYIGAWVKEKTSGTQNFTMELYNKEGSLISSCILPKAEITTSGNDVSCLVKALVPEKDEYYVCIKKTSGTGEYKTKAYVSTIASKNCGFMGLPVGDLVSSYKIFSVSKYFGSVGSVNINDTLSTGNSFIELTENYLNDKYDGFDCSSGCVIPIKFISSIDQTVTVNNVSIKYDKVGISGAEMKTIYDVTENKAKISSKMQTLKIDNIFKLPSTADSYDYKMKFNGNELFSKKILVEKISVSVSPLRTARGFPTNFNLSGIYGQQYFWDFGDGTNATTLTNSVTHNFNEIGNYTLTIKVIDGTSEFLNKFSLVVESPEILINTKLDALSSDYALLNTQISKYDAFSQQILTEKLNLTGFQNDLNNLKAKQKVASSSTDYDAIIEKLISLEIPNAISLSSTAKVPFYSQKETLDLNALNELTGETIDPESDSMKSAIIYWDQQNVDLKVSIKNYIVRSDSEKILETVVFEVTVSPKNAVTEPFYFFIKDNEDLFIEDSGMQNVSGYKVIPITQEKTVTFSLPDATLTELPVFVSPAVSQLNLAEVFPEAEKSNRIRNLVWSLIGVFVFGVIVYLLLHRWYRIKYENYLFKDRNNLYNVMIYVNGVKKQGMPNETIKENLKKSGWNSEQIRYIMRKYEGRETGLPSFSFKFHKIPSSTSSQK